MSQMDHSTLRTVFDLEPMHVGRVAFLVHDSVGFVVAVNFLRGPC